MTANDNFGRAQEYAQSLAGLLAEKRVVTQGTARGGFDVPLEAQRGSKYARVSGQVRVLDNGTVDAHLFLREPNSRTHLPGSFSYYGPAGEAPTIERVAEELNLGYLEVGPAPVVCRTEPVSV